MATVRLFVYGTLRRGQANHAELADARYLGAASTEPRYAIVERAGYPALTSGAAAVPGELYELRSEALPRLDAFEGSGYLRGPVSLADGTLAIAYFSADRAP